VLISGGNGLIGRRVAEALEKRGHRVRLLVRVRKTAGQKPVFVWNPERGVMDRTAVKEANVIIHLAGANIGARRWTKARKKEIVQSRVKTAEMLFHAVKKSGVRLEAFITASAAGWYGARTSSRIFTEDDPPAEDFLGTTCRLWEEAAGRFEEVARRVVKVRSGVVLAARRGALPKMAVPVRLGMGASLGSGKQFLPWIHIDDIAGIYLQAVEDETMRGAYNAVAPHGVTLDEFMRTLARVLKKPYLMPPIPAVLLKIVLGEMSSLVLEGSRLSAEKIKQAGYTFRFETVEQALKDLYHRR